MQTKKTIVFASIVSLLWVLLWALVYLPSLFQLGTVMGRQAFDNVFIFTMPLIVIWAFAWLNIIKNGNRDQGLDLQNQINDLQKRMNRLNLESETEEAKTPTEKEKGDVVKDSPLTLEPLTASRDVLAHAINFADDENDTEAFAALEIVSNDKEIRNLLDLSMQMLQALANANISVELLPTNYALPAEWRQSFPSKNRQTLSKLGTVGNSDHHAIVQQMFEQNASLIAVSDRFIDSALELISRFIGEAEDQQIYNFANSRTIRVCILIHSATAANDLFDSL